MSVRDSPWAILLSSIFFQLLSTVVFICHLHRKIDNSATCCIVQETFISYAATYSIAVTSIRSWVLWLKRETGQLTWLHGTMHSCHVLSVVCLCPKSTGSGSSSPVPLNTVRHVEYVLFYLLCFIFLVWYFCIALFWHLDFFQLSRNKVESLSFLFHHFRKAFSFAPCDIFFSIKKSLKLTPLCLPIFWMLEWGLILKCPLWES